MAGPSSSCALDAERGVRATGSAVELLVGVRRHEMPKRLSMEHGIEIPRAVLDRWAPKPDYEVPQTAIFIFAWAEQ